jgi:hypothetical protein
MEAKLPITWFFGNYRVTSGYPVTRELRAGKAEPRIASAMPTSRDQRRSVLA